MFRHNRVVFQDCNNAGFRPRSEAAYAVHTGTQWIGKLLSMFRESIQHFSWIQRWRTSLYAREKNREEMEKRRKKKTHTLYRYYKVESGERGSFTKTEKIVSDEFVRRFSLPPFFMAFVFIEMMLI